MKSATKKDSESRENSGSKCPEPVRELIAVANSIRFDAELPPGMAYRRPVEEWHETFKRDRQEETDRAFDLWIRDLKRNPDVLDFPILKRFLENHPGETQSKTYIDRLGAKRRFDALRSFLSMIVQHAEFDRDERENNPGESFPTWMDIRQADISIRLLISDSGPKDRRYRKIEVQLDPMLQSIEGCDIRRFRQCPNPNCRAYFWADRLEREGCELHNDQVRQWRSRLNKAIEAAEALISKIEMEKLKDQPKRYWLDKWANDLQKQRTIMERYRVAAKKQW